MKFTGRCAAVCIAAILLLSGIALSACAVHNCADKVCACPEHDCPHSTCALCGIVRNARMITVFMPTESRVARAERIISVKPDSPPTVRLTPVTLGTVMRC